MKIAGCLCVSLLWVVGGLSAPIEVSDLNEWVRLCGRDNQEIRLCPGTYRMSDYLTPEVLQRIRGGVDRTQRRPPVAMLALLGSGNVVDCTGATIEIDTSLYALLPKGGYTRCVTVAGSGNRIVGLSIRNTGSADRGSNGNLLSVAGRGNTLEEVVLHIRGSFPYGYGDLLGKGGPNLLSLQKQSGIQVLGSETTLRRCSVLSEAFGHCFYIQGGDDIRLEECRAEGTMRSTNDMLKERQGPAFELGFRSVYKNREGRFTISPGYMKSLSEDGFRTYEGAGRVTLVNCVAIHTRAGFEIGARDEANDKSIVENCEARGCERGFFIGSNTLVRGSRGDITHGPLLYLRGGTGSDVELELIGEEPRSLVHAVATLAGEHHRVRISIGAGLAPFPAVPIMLGFAPPAHGEMASPMLAAPSRKIDLSSDLPFAPIISSDQVSDCVLRSAGRKLQDGDLRRDPGPWRRPQDGSYTGASETK